MYRLSFDSIPPTEAQRMELDGRPISEQYDDIPESLWYRVQTEREDPWDQYRTLKGWAETKEQPIRNVKLERRIDEPQWEEVTD